jgi:hypothetical protein
MLVALDSVDSPELEAVAAEAFLSTPAEERWARKYLTGARSREFTDRTATTIVHTAVAGIALACVPDADARLTSLLLSTIELVERMTAVPGAPASQQGNSTLRSELAEV